MFVKDMRQTDTYFVVPRGRLKLREIPGESAELIYYERDETGGPRWSDYEKTIIPRRSPIRHGLERCLGVLIVVKKRRRVFYYKKIGRIHVDAVTGLGNFVEFEIASGRGLARAAAIERELVEMLGIDPRSMISCSYSDLLLSMRSRRRRSQRKEERF